MGYINDYSSFLVLRLACNFNVQGIIIIRDEESIITRIKAVAPKFLWDVESHSLENEQKATETVLICRKKFWAIV